MSDCPFESDVLDAIASHRWPSRVDDALRAHVTACESCHDLADVAGALLHEHDHAYAEMRVPSSAAIWHRSQLRAREEAARTATRPIAFAQGFAFACGLALVIAAALWAVPMVAARLPEAASLASRFPALPAPDIDVLALMSNTAVQIAMAGWLLLAPVALYLAMSRE